MPITVSLHLDGDSFMPGQEIRPFLIVENHGASPLPAPALDGRGDCNIMLRLILPDGAFRDCFLPADNGRAPQESASNLTDLAPGENRLRPFPLPGFSNGHSAQPGLYTLSATLLLDAYPSVPFRVQWYQEGSGETAIAMAAPRAKPDPSGQRCFHLFRGDRLKALCASRLIFDADNSSPTLRVVSSAPWLPVTSRARGFTAAAVYPSSGESQGEWVAWLDENTVHAAVEVFEPRECICPLSFEPGRILSVIAAEDGATLEVLISDAGQSTLALVRFFRPVPIPFPVAQADEPIEETDLTAEVDENEEDDDDGESFFPVDTEQPVVVWTYRPERPFAACAMARGVGPDADRRGLTLVCSVPEAAEIHYAILRNDEAPRNFDSITVADALILPNSPPAMAMDRDGRAHIVLLMAASAGDGGRSVVVARTSFGSDGRPRLDRGTVFHEQAFLPDQPITGAVSLFVQDGGGPWTIDWAVLLPDNRCMISSRFGEARCIRNSATISTPLTLLSYQERCYLAGTSLSGLPVFVETA